MPAFDADQPTHPTGSHSAAYWTAPGGSGRHAAAAPLAARSRPAAAPLAARSRPAAAPLAAHRRPAAQLIGLAAVLVVVAAAAIIAVRLFSHHAGTAAEPGATTTGSGNTGPAPVGAFGIATVQAGCPAAAIRRAAAACPANPECWAGLVEISGVVSVESLSCDQPHYWETFAIAVMPAGARTFDEPTLAENPTVRAVCSLPVLLASRRVDARRIPASSWQIEVLPPTEAAFDSGTRTYRCVADVTGRQPDTSQFRR
jgi:hypothetical protein